MERLEGERSKSVIFLDPQGYLYYEDKISRGGKVYFRCRERKTCPARVVDQTTTIPHNHPPDGEEVQKLRFMAELRRRARLENTEALTIYEEVCRHHAEGALLYGDFTMARQLIHRARREGAPPIPADLDQLGEFLLDPRWHRRYALEVQARGRPFFRGILRARDDSRLALFLSPTMENFIAENPIGLTLHADATFKVVPRVGGAQQLFGIHLLRENGQHDEGNEKIFYADVTTSRYSGLRSVILKEKYEIFEKICAEEEGTIPPYNGFDPVTYGYPVARIELNGEIILDRLDDFVKNS